MKLGSFIGSVIKNLNRQKHQLRGLTRAACGHLPETRPDCRTVQQSKAQTPIDWLIGVLTARQHRKVNLCQLRGKETGSVG